MAAVLTFLSCDDQEGQVADRFPKRRIRKVRMIDLLIQVLFVFAVLTVLSLFFCTLPVWLIVVVVVLLLR
jgi:fatty acid desaturase